MRLEKIQMPVELCNIIYSYIGIHPVAKLIKDYVKDYEFYFVKSNFKSDFTEWSVFVENEYEFKYNCEWVYHFYRDDNNYVIGIKGNKIGKLLFDIECNNAIKMINIYIEEERMIDDFEDEIENNMEYNIEAFYGGSYTEYENDEN